VNVKLKRPAAADDRPVSVDPVIVVGAGFAGLAAAAALVDAGQAVTLIEATKHGGGRSRSFDDKVLGREIDNGQHLVMGCYSETQIFLERIGQQSTGIHYQPNLAVKMLTPGGKEVDIRCPPLPAPLHLAAGLMGMRGVGILHRLSALRAGLLLRGEVRRPDDNETCDAWLERMGQTRTMRNVFWEPLIWAVLNDDPLVASAAMLVAVLEQAFMGERAGSRLGVPRLPLSKLYVNHGLEYLRKKGMDTRMGAPVRSFDIDEESGRICGVTLRGGETLRASKVISAVPPGVLLELIPETSRNHLVFQDVARLESSPIVNLWARLRRPLFDQPFVGLVGSPLHWLFDRDRIEGKTHADGTLVCATISGARGFLEDDSEVLRELFVGELGRYFPKTPIDVLGFRVIKEKRATISHAAGTYQRRPPVRSPIPGLFLAGDWVRTGLPATIESAVQSGHTAARAAAS
jgi:squalene-associated FAD-dependent desaturase